MPSGTGYQEITMANAYTQIHIQVVFAVKNRRSLIPATRNQDLYKYISGIVQIHNHKLLQINGMPDHIHLFFGMRPALKVQGFVMTNKVKSVIPLAPFGYRL